MKQVYITLQKALLLIAGIIITHAVLAQTPTWIMGVGSADDDNGNAVAIDASGNVYITGQFSGTIDMDPGPGTTQLTSKGDKDIFVARYDASGNLIWAKAIGGTGVETAKAILLDNEVYIGGSFSGTVDFDPGPTDYNLTTPGSSSAFICKLTTSGDFVWARQTEVTSAPSSQADLCALKLDNTYHLVSTGTFAGTVDFDPNAGSEQHSASGGYNVFVWKLDINGNYYQVFTIEAFSVNGMTNDGSCIVGNFSNTVDFDPGPGTYNLTATAGNDMFVLMLSTSGSFVWAAATSGATFPDQTQGYGITMDQHANVYIGGQYTGTTDFDPGPGTFTLTSDQDNDLWDMFLLKLNGSGNFVWAKKIGGTGNDWILDLDRDADDHIYATGAFSGAVDFDPNAGEYIMTSGTAVLGSFVSEFDPEGNLVWAKRMSGGILSQGSDILVKSDLVKEDRFISTGVFSGTVSVETNSGIQSLISISGSQDIYLLDQYACGTHVQSQSSNLSVQDGENATLWINPTDAYYIVWQKGDGSVFNNLYNDSQYSGVHTDTLLITAASLALNNLQYRCIIASKKGECADTSDAVILTVNSATGIEEWNDEAPLRVYPNPATQEFIIQSNVKDLTYTLVNVLGVTVTTGKTQATTTQVDISELPSGIYMLHIGNRMYKVLKQ